MGDLSAFAGLVVIAAINGRSLSHKQQGAVEETYGGTSDDFWQRHCWLDFLLNRFISSLMDMDRMISETTEPMLLFQKMAAQATTIYLHNISISRMQEDDEKRDACWREESIQKCLSAAKEIAHLARAMMNLSYLTVSYMPRWLSFQYACHKPSDILESRSIPSLRTFCTRQQLPSLPKSSTSAAHLIHHTSACALQLSTSSNPSIVWLRIIWRSSRRSFQPSEARA